MDSLQIRMCAFPCFVPFSHAPFKSYEPDAAKGCRNHVMSPHVIKNHHLASAISPRHVNASLLLNFHSLDNQLPPLPSPPLPLDLSS